MRTVQLPPADNPIAVNKYIISYQQLLFKLHVVLWVVHHAVRTVPSEILEKQTDCIFSVTELVKVAA